MEFWEGLDAHIKILIETGAGLTALSLVYIALKKVWLSWKDGFHKMAWLFSEEHDHKIIKESLDEIRNQLTNNGGASLKDALDRIEHKQDFMSSYMRTSLQANKTAIFETDAVGQIIYVNLAYARLTGYSTHEVMRMGWVNIIKPEERQHVVELWNKAVKSQRNFDEYITLQRPNGDVYRVHALGYVILSDAGVMLGHIGEIIPIGNTRSETT